MVFLEKYIVPELVKKFLPFTELSGSAPFSQKRDTAPCTDSCESSLHI